MAKRESEISLDFVSNIKFTDFCVLVFSYLKNVLDIIEDDFFKVEISLREVINNAIIHGNKSDISKRVFVKFRWSKKYLEIRIKDENTQKVNFEEIDKQLQEKDILSFDGRGLMIMRSYMDKVEFIPSEKGTEIIISLPRSQSDQH